MSLDILVQSRLCWRPSSLLLRESCFFFENRFSEPSPQLDDFRQSLGRLDRRRLCPGPIAFPFSVGLQTRDPEFQDSSAVESWTQLIHHWASDMREAPCTVSSRDLRAELGPARLQPFRFRLQEFPERLVKSLPPEHRQNLAVLQNFNAPPKRLAQLLRDGQTVSLLSCCSFDQIPNRQNPALLLDH